MITGLGYAFLGQQHWRRRAIRRVVTTGLRTSLYGASTLFLQNPDDLMDLRAAGAIPNSVPTRIVRGSGVDIDYFDVASLPKGPPVFLFIGRLLKEKGIEDFVELARRVRAYRPDVVFRVVGPIDPNPASIKRAEIEQWVREGVIDYVGEVDDVRPHLASSHVLILPSYREGTPRAVLEAMSMGRPVIVTDVPGCRETIHHGVQGLMVAAGNPTTLVAAADQFLAQPALIHEMGLKARDRIESIYDARDVAAAMADAMGL